RRLGAGARGRPALRPARTVRRGRSPRGGPVSGAFPSPPPPPPPPPRPRPAWYGGVFLTAAVLFGGFALPAVLYLPPDRPGALTLAQAARVGFTKVRATLRQLRTLPDLRGFLLAYLFFEDGINTVV